jgi:hypothetical protein
VPSQILAQNFLNKLQYCGNETAGWGVDVSPVCCSEAVKIIFFAIGNTISEIEEKSVKQQERNIKDNLIKIVRCFFIFLFLLFCFPIKLSDIGILYSS